MCESSRSFRVVPHRIEVFIFVALLVATATVPAQTLINVDFGVGKQSAKSGFAAIGQSTNDFWNLYRHYDPKFVPGMPLVSDGTLANLKFADGMDSKISVSVTNAPGVWGNATGDPMYDTYVFSQNGSNIIVSISGLEAARYHFYFYGHADPDVMGEQNSGFSLRNGTNSLGPLTTLGSSGWKATSPWQERYQYVVFRDVAVEPNQPVIIEVAAGPNGIPVLNGMQIISRGTSPPRILPAIAAGAPTTLTNLIFKSIRYEGRVTDSEARFAVNLEVESLATNEVSGVLFEGDVAVVAPEIPEGLRIVSAARKYRLIATRPGNYQLHLDLVARITKAEPWNQISFFGPPTAIASVDATANSGVQMQLLCGTQANADQKTISRVQGFLGADRTVAFRWQSKTAEIARKSLITVDTVANAYVTPTVIKYTTELKYEILQAGVPKLTVSVPAGHAVTRIQGEQVRDWNLAPDGERQLLNVEFIKPIEKSYVLTLFTEQNIEQTPATLQLQTPQPLNVERESGSFNVSDDDMQVAVDSAIGLRQVNAAKGMLASFRFYGRPFTLAAGLRRIEPVVKVFDRIGTRLEETRLLITHAVSVTVEKAGIYSLELLPQAGFNVADVTGEGIDDWKIVDGRLRINFSSRVLGARNLQVQLEQPQKNFLQQFTVSPLRVPTATNQTTEIGAGSALGIRLKTAGELVGLREIPVHLLKARSDELLAFRSEQPDWQLTIAAERLPARIVAEVFNLMTIGDGLVGGSATIRYGLINQGVQDFRVKIPAHWKNVEFTGGNIQRKELVTNAAAITDTNSAIWAITLQDKAWGGYTLVITYDCQFD